MTALEIAVSRLLGDEEREPLPAFRRDVDLDAVVDGILEPALAPGRCLVAFSGGREASWLLAAATAAARRGGYADPIPVTLRRGTTDSRVVRRQERVVAHLGLEDWERLQVDDELDVLGPCAQRALAANGLTFPATLYVYLPILDLARGGWLLSGGGLNDFFLYWRRGRLAQVVTGRRRPRRRDLRELGSALLPRRAQNTLIRRRRLTRYPWLREDAAAEVDHLMLRLLANVPIGFASAVARQRTHRCHLGMRASFDAFAATAGARAMMPFRDDRYMGAIAAAGGRAGFVDRASLLRRVAGHLLPADLLTRSDGPNAQPFFGPSSRAFAGDWSGAGVDSEIVDADALRAIWQGDELPWGSAMLLQLAFAHDRSPPPAAV